jgi:hypothetical protein
LSLSDAALSDLQLRVVIAKSLICDVELSTTIVVSSEAVATPLIGGPASDFNTHISAIASLSVYELWGSASQGTEQAAVALL